MLWHVGSVVHCGCYSVVIIEQHTLYVNFKRHMHLWRMLHAEQVGLCASPVGMLIVLHVVTTQFKQWAICAARTGFHQNNKEYIKLTNRHCY